MTSVSGLARQLVAPCGGAGFRHHQVGDALAVVTVARVDGRNLLSGAGPENHAVGLQALVLSAGELGFNGAGLVEQ